MQQIPNNKIPTKFFAGCHRDHKERQINRVYTVECTLETNWLCFLVNHKENNFYKLVLNVCLYRSIICRLHRCCETLRDSFLNIHQFQTKPNFKTFLARDDKLYFYFGNILNSRNNVKVQFDLIAQDYIHSYLARLIVVYIINILSTKKYFNTYLREVREQCINHITTSKCYLRQLCGMINIPWA